MHPQIPASDQFLLNAEVAVALCSGISSSLDQPVSVKWPNDIYVADRKIAGILIQNVISGSKIRYSVVGIGLNVNQEDFAPSLPNPTSLYLEGGQIHEPFAVCQRICVLLAQHLHRQPSAKRIIGTYNALLYRRGQETVFEDLNNGERFDGRIARVGTDGKLRIDGHQGERSYAFNEIKMITDER